MACKALAKLTSSLIRFGIRQSAAVVNQSAAGNSVNFDTSLFDNRSPPLRFCGDEGGKGMRRHGAWLKSDRCQARLHVGRFQAVVDRSVEFADDAVRRAGRSNDAVPIAYDNSCESTLDHSGHSRQVRMAPLTRHRERSQLAGIDQGQNGWSGIEYYVYLSRQQIVDGCRGTSVNHVNDIDASPQFKELTEEVNLGSKTRRPEMDFARVGLGIVDKLGDRLRRH